MVIPLEESTDITRVGGKAAALAKLLKNGCNVPPGIVIPADSELNEQEIVRAFDALYSPLVAVRSSATNEDGQTASWAGQFDTFLNVGRGELMDKVQACKASGNSERASAYGKPGKVAVIVQVMVASKTSGIAFSAHPVTHDKNELVIEAVEGLGEQLVSGEVTPDTYTVNKATGAVSSKSVMPPGSQAKLSDAQIQEVSQLVVKLESEFGYPVDVEWTYDEHELYVLQCRPITTLG